MKSFIVAALLVACVAGQSLDTLKLNRDSSSLLKLGRPSLHHVGQDLLLKQRLVGHPLVRDLVYQGEDNVVDVPSYHNLNLQDEVIVDQPLLQLEEIVSHPLFRVYYQLPLFQQYWQYPAFQRYVASILFQRFWQVPAFQQYFVNPILFNRYVLPLVQLCQQQRHHQQQVIPSIYNIYNQQQRYNTVEDLIRNRDVYSHVPSSIYVNNQCHVRNSVYAQALLEQIYRHLNLNNVLVNGQEGGRLNEVLTEVQLTPEGVVREQTLGEIVDPVTGHVRLSVGDAKLVDERIIPVSVQSVLPVVGQRDIYNYHHIPSVYNRIHHQQQYYNPLVARLLQGYNYGQRLPVVHHQF